MRYAPHHGDVDGLRNLLSADARLVGDGGGKAPQWARTVAGAVNVARLLAGAYALMTQVDITFEPREVNGQPGALFRDRDGKVLHILALDIVDGRIRTIRSVINPDKLSHLGPVPDAWALDQEVKQARSRRKARHSAGPPKATRHQSGTGPAQGSCSEPSDPC